MKTPPTGTKFGRLTFTGNVRRSNKATYVVTEYECECSCGKVRYFHRANLVSGHSTSCGCYALETRTSHGMTNSSTYRSWDSMVQRVTNPSLKSGKNYFDKGIDMDPRWLEFSEFLSDMGERPDGTSIERLDGSKGYWKWNCVWADRKTQNRNTSRNVFVEIAGRKVTLAQAIEEHDIKGTTVRNRILRGEDPLSALTRPVSSQRSVCDA